MLTASLVDSQGRGPQAPPLVDGEHKIMQPDDRAKDEDVIVQIMGTGPVKTVQTEVKSGQNQP